MHAQDSGTYGTCTVTHDITLYTHAKVSKQTGHT
jgi:catalase